MADDRRKMLEALAAKRKAESQAPMRHSKPKLSSPPSRPVVKSGGGMKPSSFSLKDTPKTKPSSFSLKDTPKIKASSFSLKETPKKKKRLEKYESEGSSAEDDDSLSSDPDAGSGDDSDMEITKKPVKTFLKPSKGQVPMKHEAKGSKPVRTGVNEKGREDPKSKSVSKQKAKATKKADDSSDEGVSDEDDGGDISNDSGDEVDPTNILPSRTRRPITQNVHYDFGNVSGEDDDSDD